MVLTNGKGKILGVRAERVCPLKSRTRRRSRKYRTTRRTMDREKKKRGRFKRRRGDSQKTAAGKKKVASPGNGWGGGEKKKKKYLSSRKKGSFGAGAQRGKKLEPKKKGARGVWEVKHQWMTSSGETRRMAKRLKERRGKNGQRKAKGTSPARKLKRSFGRSHAEVKRREKGRARKKRDDPRVKDGESSGEGTKKRPKTGRKACHRGETKSADRDLKQKTGVLKQKGGKATRGNGQKREKGPGRWKRIT